MACINLMLVIALGDRNRAVPLFNSCRCIIFYLDHFVVEDRLIVVFLGMKNDGFGIFFIFKCQFIIAPSSLA